MNVQRRARRIAATGILGIAVAAGVGFALADSSDTQANKAPQSAQTPKIRSLQELQSAAHSLDRSRGSEDILPPKLVEMLAALPDQAPDAAIQSMHVLSAEGVGDLYVAPSLTGFAILSTIGFAGTVPGGLSESNPAVGGTAVLPDGRLALMGIVSDAVSVIQINVKGETHQADREANGVWWVSRSSSLDPDDLTVTAVLKSGRVVRIF